MDIGLNKIQDSLKGELYFKLVILVHACNSSTLKGRGRRFKTNLSHIARHCLNHFSVILPTY